MSTARSFSRRVWFSVAVAVLALLSVGIWKMFETECDIEATTALAERLDASSPHERAELVMNELDEVCELPEFIDAWLSNTDIERRIGAEFPSEEALTHQHEVFSRLCPPIADQREWFTDAPWEQRSRILFDTCELGRLGIIERERYIRDDVSIVPWATFQWLEEQKVDRNAAVSITQALLLLDRRFVVRALAPKHLRVPSVEGGTVMRGGDPIVYVSTDELRLDGDELAKLEGGRFEPEAVAGHVVTALYERLSEELENGGERNPRILIAADATLPFATLQDVVYTATRAGHEQFGLIVEVEPYVYEALPFEVPLRASSGTTIDYTFLVTIDERGFTVLGEQIGEQPAALAQRAAAHRKAYPNASLAVLTPAEEVEVELICWAITALRGRECGTLESRCVLPRVVFGGHATSPAPASAPP